jgi:acetolactate synthase regulatory subunit
VTENSQPPTSDRDYLEHVLRRIERLGVEVEQRSHLIAVASRLHHLRTRESDPREIELLDFQLDAIMRVIDGGDRS